MGFLQDLLGIKAEEDMATAKAEQQRQRGEELEAAREAKRRRQGDALIEKWDGVVREYLAKLGKVYWGYEVRIETFFSPVSDIPGQLRRGRPLRKHAWLQWHLGGGDYFAVVLDCPFNERDELMQGVFVVKGEIEKKVEATGANLEKALKEVFRAGPYEVPRGQDWMSGIGGSPLS